MITIRSVRDLRSGEVNPRTAQVEISQLKVSKQIIAAGINRPDVLREKLVKGSILVSGKKKMIVHGVRRL